MERAKAEAEATAAVWGCNNGFQRTDSKGQRPVTRLEDESSYRQQTFTEPVRHAIDSGLHTTPRLQGVFQGF